MRLHLKRYMILKYEIPFLESYQESVQGESHQQESETRRRFTDQSKSKLQSLQEAQRIHLNYKD